MIKITLADLFNLQSSVIYNPDEFTNVNSVTIDSRNIKPNSLFVAIKGEKFDGHDFAKIALKNGASAILINKSELKKFRNVGQTVIAVDDTIKSLGELAAIWRSKLSAKVISISGSNGKTTTKEVLSSILSEKNNVVKTISNNNNHIGVPLTIFSANSETECLVLEHGTNHFNEIAYTAKIASPDYGIITNIGLSHLEYLKNKKGVFDEKKVLLDEVCKNHGVIFINSNDVFLRNYLHNYKNRVSFGFNNDANVSAKIIGCTKDGKTIIEIRTNKLSFQIDSPLYGSSNAKNILAAVTVGVKLGLSKKQLLNGINKIEAVKGRLQVSQLNKTILINDTYNANPESMKAAFDVLKKIKTYNDKYLVLGDMFELGNQAEEFHKGLAKFIPSLKPKGIFLLGKNMKLLNQEIKKLNLPVTHFQSRQKMMTSVKKVDFTESVVLVKGSRGMKMEEIFETIIMGIK